MDNPQFLTKRGVEKKLADKLTDADLKTLCATCRISLEKSDGTPKTRAELLTDLFGESNSQLKATIDARTPYALVEKTATESLDNRAINKLTFTGGEGEAYAYALDSHLPTDIDGKARDFLVQISCDKPVDITYAETFAVKGDLPSVDAAGDHLLAITELHGMWLIKKLALEDAQ